MTDIITLDEYKAFASIEGKKSDAQITALIKSCSVLVTEYIGYDFGKSTDVTTVLRTRAGVNQYMLPAVDLTISKVEVQTRDKTTTSTLTDSDYVLHDYGMIEIYEYIIYNGDFLKVTYSANADATEAIKLATMLLVKHYYKEEYNKTAMGMGGQTVTYQTGKNFPPHVRAILNLYRIL